MIIECIADLHGYFPDVGSGDLLIICGDLTTRDRASEYDDFLWWMNEQEYKKKILIAGNHDNTFTTAEPAFFEYIDKMGITYLCDSGTEFEGLKIWGSPWTPWFDGVNPHCKSFMKSDNKLASTWKKIPDDTDVLITHGPPFGILDGVVLPYDGTLYHAGSKTLAVEIGKRKKTPALWVFGHIHEGYGEDLPVRRADCKMINCSYVNEKYKPVNKPIRIDLCRGKDGRVKAQTIKT